MLTNFNIYIFIKNKKIILMINETKEIIREKLKELEEKSELYRLKRYEKKEMKKYRKILFSIDKKELIVEYIKENQKKTEEKIKEENEIFIKEKENILKEKNETIKYIEDNKINKINENNIKFKNIISYLESIKNDKKKLIDYFRNLNYF